MWGVDIACTFRYNHMLWGLASLGPNLVKELERKSVPCCRNSAPIVSAKHMRIRKTLSVVYEHVFGTSVAFRARCWITRKRNL